MERITYFKKPPCLFLPCICLVFFTAVLYWRHCSRAFNHDDSLELKFNTLNLPISKFIREEKNTKCKIISRWDKWLKDIRRKTGKMQYIFQMSRSLKTSKSQYYVNIFKIFIKLSTQWVHRNTCVYILL